MEKKGEAKKRRARVTLRCGLFGRAERSRPGRVEECEEPGCVTRMGKV